MKTPHTIELVFGEGGSKLDPITGDYVENDIQSKRVPCLANYLTQAKVFELYGSREVRVLVCRFNQPQEPFIRAYYDGRVFVPLERLEAPIRSSVRLQEVVE